MQSSIIQTYVHIRQIVVRWVQDQNTLRKIKGRNLEIGEMRIRSNFEANRNGSVGFRTKVGLSWSEARFKRLETQL